MQIFDSGNYRKRPASRQNLFPLHFTTAGWSWTPSVPTTTYRILTYGETLNSEISIIYFSPSPLGTWCNLSLPWGRGMYELTTRNSKEQLFSREPWKSRKWIWAHRSEPLSWQRGKVQREAGRRQSKMMISNNDFRNSVADNNCSLKCPEALIW